MKQVNIGIEEDPKIAMIYNYWDEHTITKIVAILCKHANLFLQSFTQKKGMVGELGKMNIFEATCVVNREKAI
jgi:hypothetical protein